MTRLTRTDREAAVVAAAAELFDASGVRSTTTEAVAAAAGVSKATVFALFATREHLVSRVLVHQLDELAATLEGLTADDGRAAVAEWHRRCFAYARAHPAFAESALALLTQPWAVLQRSTGELVQLQVGRSVLPVLAPLTAALRRLDEQAGGRLAAALGDLDGLAETLYAGALGVMGLLWHGRGTRAAAPGVPTAVPLDPAALVSQQLALVDAALTATVVAAGR